MSGEKNLNRLLSGMNPCLIPGEFVFCTLKKSSGSKALDRLMPLATFREAEGLSILVEKKSADAAGLDYSGIFRGITLQIHSDLQAVGFTAAIASALTEKGISANVIAARYHDHVFVPSDRIEPALAALGDLIHDARSRETVDGQ
jgi:hypothetical protein